MDRQLTNPAAYRQRVVSLLALLSSDEAQQILGKRVGSERLAHELCRVWFDRIYVPSETYLDGLRGDVSQEAVERFREAFDDAELAALERFHRFVELRMNMIPASSLEEGRIPQNDSWAALMKDAGYLLDALDADAESLKTRLVDDLNSAHVSVRDLIIPEESPRDKGRLQQGRRLR